MVPQGPFRRPFAVVASAAVLVAGCGGRTPESLPDPSTAPVTTIPVDTSTTGPTTTVDETEPDREHTVGLFGDSLAWEAEPYYDTEAATLSRSPVKVVTFGGTAICDMVDDMRTLVQIVDFGAVQLAFSGNALTECMAGYVPGSEAYFEKYRNDALEAVSVFAPAGTRVILVAPPRMGNSSSTGVDVQEKLGEIYRAIAAGDPDHVSFIDAGAAVETPDGRYTDTLPCLPGEPCTGPLVSGIRHNVVRSADRVHFCPVVVGNAAGIVERCPVHSSGAYRYARAMASTLLWVG